MALWLVAGPVQGQTVVPASGACASNLTPQRVALYMATTPTAVPTKVATLAPVNLSDLTPSIWPCPTTAGTYYLSMAWVQPDGSESARGGILGIIVGPFAPAPPVALAIGTKVIVNTAVGQPLNVRPAPTLTSCSVAGLPACPTVARGTPGTILDGPVVANNVTWWKVDWGGWSSQAYLVPAP